MEISQMQKQIRLLCGDPDLTEVKNSDIQSMLTNQTLKWLNKQKPGRAINSFETVADQQDYSEKPSNAYHITEVWWMDSDFEFFSPDLRYVPPDQDINLQMAGFNIIDNPALTDIFYKNIEAYKTNFKGTGRETAEGKIRLESYPANSGDDVYFEYSYPRWDDVENVPDEYTDAMIYYCAHLVLNLLFVKRGRIRSGRAFTGGGGTNERELAQEYQEEAETILGLSSFAVSRG